MIIKEFLIFFVIAALSQSSFADDDSSPYKLKAVYVTVRAGQTEEPKIELTTKTDVNKNFMEDVRLSESGRQTIYDLGKTVNEYYKSKFGDSKEIKLLSNGCAERRCRASAALFRKGFENNKDFKKEQEISEEDMKNTYDKDQAELSGRFYTNCSAFMTEAFKSTTEMWKEKKNEFKGTVDIIEDKLGKNYTTHPYNLWLTWESYYSMSKQEPDWLKENVKEDLKNISGEYFEAAFSTKNARKLSAGFLIGVIQGDTFSFDDSDFDQIKVYVAPLPELEATAAWFSGPNGYYKNICTKDQKWNYLEHGSLIALEIYESFLARGDSDLQYGVKILIKNGNEPLSDASAVSIKGCDQEICPLTKVIDILKDYITNKNELDQYCKGAKKLE